MTTEEKMTTKEKIVNFLFSTKPCSAKEIAEALKMSEQNVHYHFRSLIKKGVVIQKNSGLYAIGKLTSEFATVTLPIQLPGGEVGSQAESKSLVDEQQKKINNLNAQVGYLVLNIKAALFDLTCGDGLAAEAQLAHTLKSYEKVKV